MKVNSIPLESFKIKSLLRDGSTGKVLLTMENGELRMTTLVEGLSKKHQNYVYIVDKFKLPFRIDMTVKTNSTAFKIKTGKGHILFMGSFNRGGFGIRRADILTGKEETTKNDYDRILPIDEYVDLSVIYGSKTMWVEFNGQPGYYTGKAPYITALKNNDMKEYENGLDFAIVCGENVVLKIKSLKITEYENDEPAIHEEIANMPELSAFEWYLKSLPHEIRGEAVKTDAYLMNDMKTILQFKKSIDKDGKLTYESPCGFRYSMNRYGINESHGISWDKLGSVLYKLAETSPDFANNMFANINGHVSSRGGDKCNQCTAISCANMKSIEFDGKTRRACGGTMQFKWLPSEFENVRKVVAAVSVIVSD